MRRKRKPDLLALLAFLVGVGVVITSLAQGLMPSNPANPALAEVQQVHKPISEEDTRYQR